MNFLPMPPYSCVVRLRKLSRRIIVLFWICCAAFLVLAGSLPAFAGIAIAENEGEVVLKNGSISLGLDKTRKGAIRSLRDLQTGEEFIAPSGCAPLFTLELVDAAGQPVKMLESGEATICAISVKQAENEGSVSLDYQFSNPAAAVHCVASVSASDPLIRWRISVRHDEPLRLASMMFPTVTLRAAAGDDGKLVSGATKGGIKSVAGMKTGEQASWQQPGTLAAQFVTFYRNKGGVYLAAQDSNAVPKQIEAKRVPPGLDIYFKPLCFASKEYATDYDIVLTTFRGRDGAAADWRDAADLYKQWALKQKWCSRTLAQREDLPPWIKEGAAMAQFDREWMADPSLIEKWAARYWKTELSPDVPMMMSIWGWEKIARWVAPDYFPSYPSDEQFTGMIRNVRAMGGHVACWPSGYQWSLGFNRKPDGTLQWDGSEAFSHVSHHAVYEADGNVRLRKPSWLKGGETACLCPGDVWTRQFINEKVGVPLAQRGVEVIQVDQMVGGRFPMCYAGWHDHAPGPGQWMTDVFVDHLATLAAAVRSIEKDSILSVEEPNESFIQQIGIQDYRDCENRDDWADVFNYLYHEYVVTFQPGLGGDPIWMASCLVNGQMPHLFASFRSIADSEPVNGGFEYEADGVFPQWTVGKEYRHRKCAGKVFRDTANQHGGAASIGLEPAGETDVVQISQNIHLSQRGLKAGGRYRLSAWVKNRAGTGRAAVVHTGYAEGWRQLPGEGEMEIPLGAADWKPVSVDFRVPEEASFIRIMLVADGPARVNIDDIALHEITADGRLKAVVTSLPPGHELLKRWIALYRGEGRPYLLYGTMLHKPPLEVEQIAQGKKMVPAILHNAFRAPDGSEAVVLANATNQSRQGVLDWKGKKRSIALDPGETALIKTGN